MGVLNTTAERGKFKMDIHKALFKSEPIKEMLLGDTSDMSKSEIKEEFKKYVKSHLFVDELVTETKTYIFYDVDMPVIRPNIKSCNIYMYLVCHRDILETYSKEGYYGDRIDILGQMVEDALINDKDMVNKFGIGKLTLDSISIYNTTKLYGCLMTFTVPNFR